MLKDEIEKSTRESFRAHQQQAERLHGLHAQFCER